jgi:hypothetical protein
VSGRRWSAAGLVLAAALSGVPLTGCTSGGSTPDASRTTTPVGRDAQWRADLETLLPGLADLHPDLSDGVPTALSAEVAQLVDAVPTSTDDELMVGVMRVITHVASTGRDGHTGLFVWGVGAYETHSLPLRLWFFADGLYVEDALPPDRGLIGARVVGVAGHPLREVLHGLGIAGSLDTVQLEVVDRRGRHRSIDVAAVSTTAYNAWAGEYGLHLVERPGLLATAHPDEVVWHKLLPDRRTLYVGYNQVQTLDPDEMTRIARIARSDAVDRVVVDIRRNFGGEVGDEDPMLDLLADPRLRGKRLYLLTARNTFSAGSRFAAELVDRVDVTVVGEPTGGAPTAYGNASELALGDSGLVVSVATTREVAVSPRDRRTAIEPDIPVTMSFADWFAGRDTVLEAAINDGG